MIIISLIESIDKLNKTINSEQFERVKARLELDLENKQKIYNELTYLINDKSNDERKNNSINKYVDKFLGMKQPTRELIVNLIDKIEIYEDKSINIHFSFSKL